MLIFVNEEFQLVPGPESLNAIPSKFAMVMSSAGEPEETRNWFLLPYILNSPAMPNSDDATTSCSKFKLEFSPAFFPQEVKRNIIPHATLSWESDRLLVSKQAWNWAARPVKVLKYSYTGKYYFI